MKQPTFGSIGQCLGTKNTFARDELHSTKWKDLIFHMRGIIICSIGRSILEYPTSLSHPPQAFEVKMETEPDVSTKFLAGSDISCRITPIPIPMCFWCDE